MQGADCRTGLSAGGGGAVLWLKKCWLRGTTCQGCQVPTTVIPPTGIIDLSQVPHLPVLVPPTPGTPATAIDRLAYLPTAPPPFSSRHSSSPLSPGAPTKWVGGYVPHSFALWVNARPLGSSSDSDLGVSRRPHSPG